LNILGTRMEASAHIFQNRGVTCGIKANVDPRTQT
jgi:hypothetical protein